MLSKPFVLLCKDADDLFEIMPLYHQLMTRGYNALIIHDGTATEARAIHTLPMTTRSATCAHQLDDVLKEGVAGIVSCCHKGRGRLLEDLHDELKHIPVFIFPDPRKVYFCEYTKRLEAKRVYLLANDSSVPHIGCKERYVTGLPRYDAVVRMSTQERIKRRRHTRANTNTGINDFVVLFLGQEFETARVLQDLSTALRAIPALTSDRPIKRVLMTWRLTSMDTAETQLWCDVLSLRSDVSPGLRVLDSINSTTQVTALEAMLAADLVVSSTHEGLLTAVALGMKAVSYLAPGAGETAYKNEIAGYLDTWEFSPAHECIRRARTYQDLREAINQAIPISNVDGSITHPTWPEQEVARTADWTQGRNTSHCIQAIERVLAQ